MLFLFKDFSKQYPKFYNRLCDAALLTGLFSAAVLATESIEDPTKREIAWNNFLDEDGYKRDLAAYEREKSRP